MSLEDDLTAAADAAGAYGVVAAVLAAEPLVEGRTYLVALGEDDDRRWLALDGALQPIGVRERLRAIASIVVLSELAGELAGGGQLAELREQLAQVRMTEQPEGIELAEEAALALERTVGAPPLIASPLYLDEVGVAARALERALGDHGSPFASALAASSGTIDAFVAEVIERYALPLEL